MENKIESKSASKEETKIYNKIGKTLLLLSTEAAGRLFWTYGPGKGEITVVAIEPHPHDKSNSYNRVTLSSMGEILKK